MTDSNVNKLSVGVWKKQENCYKLGHYDVVFKDISAEKHGMLFKPKECTYKDTLLAGNIISYFNEATTNAKQRVIDIVQDAKRQMLQQGLIERPAVEMEVGDNDVMNTSPPTATRCYLPPSKTPKKVRPTQNTQMTNASISNAEQAAVSSKPPRESVTHGLNELLEEQRLWLTQVKPTTTIPPPTKDIPAAQEEVKESTFNLSVVASPEMERVVVAELVDYHEKAIGLRATSTPSLNHMTTNIKGRNGLEGVRRNLKAEVDKVAEEEMGCSAQVQKQAEELEELEEEVEEVKEQAEKLKEQPEEHEEQVEELEEQVEELEEQVEGLEEQVEEVQMNEVQAKFQVKSKSRFPVQTAGAVIRQDCKAKENFNWDGINIINERDIQAVQEIKRKSLTIDLSIKNELNLAKEEAVLKSAKVSREKIMKNKQIIVAPDDNEFEDDDEKEGHNDVVGAHSNMMGSTLKKRRLSGYAGKKQNTLEKARSKRKAAMSKKKSNNIEDIQEEELIANDAPGEDLAENMEGVDEYEEVTSTSDPVHTKTGGAPPRVRRTKRKPPVTGKTRKAVAKTTSFGSSSQRFSTATTPMKATPRKRACMTPASTSREPRGKLSVLGRSTGASRLRQTPNKTSATPLKTHHTPLQSAQATHVIKSFLRRNTPEKNSKKDEAEQKKRALEEKLRKENEQRLLVEERKKQLTAESIRRRVERQRKVQEKRDKNDKMRAEELRMKNLKESEKQTRIEAKKRNIERKKIHLDQVTMVNDAERLKRKHQGDQSEDSKRQKMMEEERRLVQIQQEKREAAKVEKARLRDEDQQKKLAANKLKQEKLQAEKEARLQARIKMKEERALMAKIKAEEKRVKKEAGEARAREEEKLRKEMEEEKERMRIETEWREERKRKEEEKERLEAINKSSKEPSDVSNQLEQFTTPKSTKKPYYAAACSSQVTPLDGTFNVQQDTSVISNYDMTPRGADRVHLPSTKDDYNIHDLKSDDETDDEDAPKKSIPSWASGSAFSIAIRNQSINPPDIRHIFPDAKYRELNLAKLFKKNRPRYFKRTSSACWSPPSRPGHVSFNMK